MKQLTAAICLLFATGAGINVAYAHEHEGDRGVNYSVYEQYRFTKAANTQKAYAAQQYVKSMLPGWNTTTDRFTGNATDMFGPATMVPGGTNKQKATAFMATKLNKLDVNPAEWETTRDASFAHASYVDFQQVIDGHKVMFSNMSFRFTPDGRLVRLKLRSYSSVNSDVMKPVLSANDAMTSAELTEGMIGMAVQTKNVEQDWVWFPIPSAKGYELHPAWVVKMTGSGAKEMPFDVTAYIDAIDGELLYRFNTVNETFDVTAKAEIFVTSPLAPKQELFLPDMNVTVGGNSYVTDANGTVSDPSLSAPQNVTFDLQGPWSIVREAGNTISFNTNITSSPDTFRLPIGDSTTRDFRAVSAFAYVNRIHDYMKTHWPTFTGMDMPMPTNIDITTNQQCNAFYNDGGFSINFYPPQATCLAFSIVSDIVYHEYGHGICYRFYRANGQNFNNGAMGEAYADVWAMCMNRDGVVGEGSFTNGSNIRSYIGAPKVYPQNLVGQVHADGEIVAGAWWDVAVNIGDIDIMSKIFSQSHYDLPNAPNGMEGDLYYDILISALMADDDDNNLGNRTPHFEQIVKAFARHGIYLLAESDFKHNDIEHQAINTPVTISGELTLVNPAFFDKILLHYRSRYANTGWDSVAMTNTTGNMYSAQIPGMPGGSIVDYYFSVEDVVNSGPVGLPAGYNPYAGSMQRMTIPYQFAVGLNGVRYKNDFEGTIDGWQLGVPGDDATRGMWVHAKPVGTQTAEGLPIQTGADHTTGTGKCLVTGNGGGGIVIDDEVANGKTTVMTPSIDVPFSQPVVEYFRWYSNDRGNSRNLKSDPWVVEIHAGTSIFWQKVEDTYEPDQRWRRRIFRVNEFLPGATNIQLRFIAQDAINTNMSSNGQNIVEAAVDDFIIYDGNPTSVNDAAPAAIKAEVYPNPADDQVNVVLPAGSKGSISVYDVSGRILHTVAVTEATAKYSINTSGLAAGTYMLLMQTQYAVQNTSFVVSHK